jgi:hypothetical protein
VVSVKVVVRSGSSAIVADSISPRREGQTSPRHMDAGIAEPGQKNPPAPVWRERMWIFG